ncbi:5-formyltetrahydrofolate cyclo-ligase [Prochlorococcus marinus]|uniref:5-formyltetrahydrofolate cyclo-ligase n=1 Tax=Prochlorococcus marinus TaxID=1219 RepID=UPI0022B31FF1|nr:5-formyltetrahydrofolate cyclo-ligase [Prochlorococcus marinus]
MKSIYDDIKSRKKIKRKEYNLIRNSNSSLIHEKIKLSVKSTLNVLLNKYHVEGKYIGIYWPLKYEVDIRFIKDINNLKVALPLSSKTKGISYHHWSNNPLERDSNNIPAPIGENTIQPNDISILFVPAIAIDQEGYRLGYGGGYFDRLRQRDLWFSIPSFVVISNNCISKKLLPRDRWDVPFNGWISEKGLHQIEATK